MRRRTVEHRKTIEVIAGHRLLRIGNTDPALAEAEAGNALALGNVFEIVPVMEFVFMRVFGLFSVT